MLIDRVKYTYIFGFIEKDGPEKKKIIGSRDLYDEHLFPSTTVKSLKIWFGSPQGKNDIKSLLGIQVKYINFITGEKKDTEYQGAPIEGMDVEVKEIEVKEGGYISKMNLAFEDYITHIKFASNKSDDDFIEFGIADEHEIRTLNELNSGNNIILNVKGYVTSNGIRALGCDFLSFNDFFFFRLIDIFRLRHMLEKDEKYKKKFDEEVAKFDDGMRCIYKFCKLPQNQFLCVIKYL